MTQVLDMSAVLASPPSGGWPPLMAGAVRPEEGRWFWNFKFLTAKGLTSEDTNHIEYKIDRTAPSAVDSLTATPSMNVADAGKWTAASRAHITWAEKQYDSLSGVGYYQLLLNDVKAVPETKANPVQGRVYQNPGTLRSSVTIEDMPPGRTKVSIVCVDRATNEGPAASTWFYSDPGEPGGSILSPAASGQLMGLRSAISVLATDDAGVSSVSIAIDGTTVRTVTPSTLTTRFPVTYAPDWTRWSNGSHTLTVTVRDMMARETVLTKRFTLDRTAPTLRSVSVAPNPFFPRRDGYRDYARVGFVASGYTTVTLEVATVGTQPRNGVTLPSSRRWYTRTTGPRTAFWYYGSSTTGRPPFPETTINRTRRLWVRIVLRDAVGNIRYSSWQPLYVKTAPMLVRIAPNKVQVIQR
jgi:hypothetical protein